MRHRTRSLIALGAVAALGLGATATLAGSASAASTTRTLALNADGKKLTLLSLATGDRLATVGNVTGLDGDTKLIGIDFRVQDHQFYGVGDAGGVYRIVSSSGRAVKESQLTVPLDGSADYGVDFNPAADRLRVVSASGLNLRHDLNTDATVKDTNLAYAPAVEGQLPAVTAVAYTNNDLNPDTATSLFDIDTNLDQVYLQSPANGGTLAATGKLGVAANPIAGFDIQSTATGGNTGYAALRTSATGTPSLYKINLLSGKATRVGFFDNNVADIAVPQP